MAQTKNARYRVHNGTDFDTIHFETSAKQVKTEDGSTVEDKIMSHFESKAPHLVPQVAVTSPHGQSIPNNSARTYLSFHECLYDTDRMYNPNAGTLITCRTSGIYLVVASAAFNPSTQGRRSIIIEHSSNGSRFNVAQSNQDAIQASSELSTRLNVSTIVKMSKGDQLRVNAIQDSGNALSVQAGRTFKVVLLSRGE